MAARLVRLFHAWPRRFVALAAPGLLLLAPSAAADASGLGLPGTLIASSQIQPPNAATRAWNIRYVTTDPDGKRIAATGIIMAPRSGTTARPVVVWAHPTSGIQPRCAPSSRGNGYKWIAGHEEMLADGFVVSAPDYPGLGTSGLHPYLVGQSEARSVIDSVRAARHIPDAHAGTQYAVWGHSQGGHAALWSASAAPYAPELQLRGVAAAAPPTDLSEVVDHTTDATSSRVVAAYIFAAWSAYYHLPLADVLKPAARAIVERVAKVCAQTPLDAVRISALTAPLRTPMLAQALQRNEHWTAAFSANNPGIPNTSIPVFIAQGLQDELISAPVSARYVKRLCSAGVHVEYHPLADVGHTESGGAAAVTAVRWMKARFEGKPVAACS